MVTRLSLFRHLRRIKDTKRVPKTTKTVTTDPNVVLRSRNYTVVFCTPSKSRITRKPNLMCSPPSKNTAHQLKVRRALAQWPLHDSLLKRPTATQSSHHNVLNK